MGRFQALLEAVDRFNKAENEYTKARTEVADLLSEAARTEQVTNLSRITKINRSTIYWLMKTWSTNREDRSA